MLLKSLKLKNIRSYSDAEFEFPEGSVLLSGDIGAGKSTILLSIEFALFGFIRGTISGSTLLRHGKKEGGVELTFISENKEYTIQRNIKRSSSSIGQDAGFLIENGVQTDLTAVELKSKILSILGYPEELLTKSKSLIFRYTVYTPQEEMKSILYESTEERLEKLRKLFEIDKYKRIKENASNITREMRSEIKSNSILIQGTDELKERIIKRKDEIKTLEEEFKQIAEKIEKLKLKEKEKIKQQERIEKSIQEIQEKKNEIKLLKQKLENTQDNLKRLTKEKEQHAKEIDEIKEAKIEKTDIEEIKNKIKQIEQKYEETNDKQMQLKQKFSIINSKKEDSEKLIKDIDKLEFCPVCKQKVTDEHKHDVEEKENKSIKEQDEKISKINEIIEKADNNKTILKTKLEKLREQLREAEKDELKRKNQEEKLRRKELLKKRLEQIKKEEQEQKEKQQELNKKINEQKIPDTQEQDKELRKQKEELEEITQNLRKQEIKTAENKKETEYKKEQIKDAEEELEKKARLKKQINEKQITENWLSGHFIKLVDNIEKHVMINIYSEFNQRFQEWFNILIEDETLQASLNETFAPQIMQNGYETEIDNLSGGEKTAVALAYRLSLNKTINDHIGSIKTKDIIILDEPTDGFSTDQLDKVRDVLEALNSKQTIIVSHEPKMESFVDKIIRIRKHEHTSEII